MLKRTKCILMMLLCLAVMVNGCILPGFALTAGNVPSKNSNKAYEQYIEEKGILQVDSKNTKQFWLVTGKTSYRLQGNTLNMAKYIGTKVVVKGSLKAGKDKNKILVVLSFTPFLTPPATSTPIEFPTDSPKPTNSVQYIHTVISDQPLYFVDPQDSVVKSVYSGKCIIQWNEYTGDANFTAQLNLVQKEKSMSYEFRLTKVISCQRDSILGLFDIKKDGIVVAKEIQACLSGIDQTVGGYFQLGMPNNKWHMSACITSLTLNSSPPSNCTPPPVSGQPKYLQSIYSNKSSILVDPTNGIWDSLTGSFWVEWNEKTNNASVHAQVYSVKETGTIFYDFKLISVKSCNTDSITGNFEIKINDKVVASGIPGEIYGLSQPHSNYFKWVMGDENAYWQVNGEITSRAFIFEYEDPSSIDRPQYSHTVISERPNFLVEPSKDTWDNGLGGRIEVRWNEKTKDASVYAQVYAAQGDEIRFYDVRLLSVTSCDRDLIRGMFEIKKDGFILTPSIQGEVYGLAQPVGSYFKCVIRDEKLYFQVNGDITCRMDAPDTVVPTPTPKPTAMPTEIPGKIHTVTSVKPIYVKDPTIGLDFLQVSSGNCTISWAEGTKSAFYNAKLTVMNGLKPVVYEFRLTYAIQSDSDSIEGLFDVLRDGIPIAKEVHGRIYGLSQKEGNYFKFYSDGEKWHMSGYITCRLDY
ncbi:MAG: hypothetical protein N2645_04455 [Clostridia bacterium]|nr:hypothetical protein [Clostridia bacterium]